MLTGSVTADRNFKYGYPLHNSEVIWRQYQLAVKWAVGRIWGSGKAKAIQDITRSHVINEDTATVARLCDKDLESGKTYEPDSPGTEFFAMLGTPNVASAGYILAQHNEHMPTKKTLASITVQGVIPIKKEDKSKGYGLDKVHIKFKDAERVEHPAQKLEQIGEKIKEEAQTVEGTQTRKFSLKSFLKNLFKS